MQMYKCNSCGAELEFEAGSNISVCSYCGSKNALNDNVFIGWNPKLTESSANDISEIEFALYADGVFKIPNRGIAVTGNIDSGSIKVNDTVKILHDDGSYTSCTVAEIEQFRKKLMSAKKNESVGIILTGIERNRIDKGDIIIKGKLNIKKLNERIISYYVPINDRAEAVSYYMKVTGLGLKAAKEKVDRLFAR